MPRSSRWVQIVWGMALLYHLEYLVLHIRYGRAECTGDFRRGLAFRLPLNAVEYEGVPKFGMFYLCLCTFVRRTHNLGGLDVWL